MSQYIDIINNIKEKSTSDWLTHSQREVYTQISVRYQTHKVINLYGSDGVGKTFIRWICCKELNFPQATDISDLKNVDTVILDNFQPSRSQSRALRPLMQQNNIERIIVLTRQKIPDDIIHIELDLDIDDVREFRHNLYMYLNIQYQDDVFHTNLHDMIKLGCHPRY
jgi:ABC-type cobalamin/Fe3+-siderophores transport system ATPase subunit